MDGQMAEWLEYGSFGLLAVVLVAIGVAAREMLGRWMDNQKAELNHQAEQDRQRATLAAERQTAADKFLQDLIAQDRQERAEHVQALQGLVAQDIEAKEKLTKALEAICERTDRNEQRADERHQQMILLFEQHRKP